MEKVWRSGNLLLGPDNRTKVIVTKCTEERLDVVYFDHDHSSGTYKMKDHVEDCQCFCDENNGGEYDQDCNYCKGTGSYERPRVGWDKATLLGSTVKEYILKCLTKNFEF